MRRKKRILVVCQHFYPESFRINEICESLVKKNIQVDVLCGIPNYPQGKFFKGYHYFQPRREIYKGINIMRVGEIPQWKKGGALFISLNYFYFPFASLFSLPRILFKKKYDCVFMYGLSPVFMSFPGIVYSRLRRVKSVYYILDYWPDSLYSVIPLKNKVLRGILQRISFWHYKNSNVVLAPSKGMLKKVRAEVGISTKRSFLLPQSCDELYETLFYSKDLHERFDGRFNLVFAGNIGPAQSLETLVDAVALLKNSIEGFAGTFRAIIVGDGMSRVTIEEKVNSMSIADCFVFEGFVPVQKVLEYHEIADALFVALSDDPLFSIMLPAKVQSYMAAGKPIVASLNGEAADTIKKADCGIVCPSGNSKELAEALKKMLAFSEEERSKLGKNGRQYYETNYRHELFVERLMCHLGLSDHVSKRRKECKD